MTLAAQYGRQYRWRSWQQAYAMLPPLEGARVLDLGCAVGDQSRDLAGLGALVRGIDADPELIAWASARGIANATFETGDIRHPTADAAFDGVWASFVPAYFPHLVPVLLRWRELLRPGGWIALAEVSDFFDHRPLPEAARAVLDAYVEEGRNTGRYDFDMGGKLPAHLEEAGFEVTAACVLPDRELSFNGPADTEVLEAWRQRFARLKPLHEKARQTYPFLQDDFLRCLSSPHHTTECRVHFCVAHRP